uniref:G-protein coupled receptors family 1 profile domain-containing protein n=1 Tax=Trichobilharzia regenti TaxID=157069 RepID=A0AA85JD01_TRIRE|nr:unnamed protein product [Trichobilharzia regenti]
MNVSQHNQEVLTPFVLNLFILNKSSACKKMESQPVLDIVRAYWTMVLILGPLNTILNGLCIYIFNHSAWKKSVMSKILKGLSIIEFGMGFSLFINAVTSIINISKENVVMNMISKNDGQNKLQKQFNENYIEEHKNDYVTTICIFFITTVCSRILAVFQISRNWSVVLLAAYRYDQICRPLGTPSSFPRERMRYILWAVFTLACLIIIPRIFESSVVVCYMSGIVSREIPLLLSYKIYQILYLGIIMFIVQSGGPVICVCVLSAFVIRVIAKRRKFHREKEKRSARNLLRRQTIETEASQANPNTSIHSKTNDNHNLQQRNSNGLTLELNERPAPSGDKLMFAVCITFFVLETPAFFSKILNPYLEKDYPLVDMTVSVIANLLIYLDSTLNAFVYMASNPLFRKIAREECIHFRDRFCCFKKTKPPLLNKNSRLLENESITATTNF